MCIKLFKKRAPFTKFSTGCTPSPLDTRDIKLSQVQTAIPLRDLPESYTIPYQLLVLNQNGFPACVGFSCASLKAEKERREQNLMDFDGKWIYDECKKVDELPNVKGTFLRLGLKILKDKGAKPLNLNENEAGKYRIGGYVTVDDVSFEGLKKAIYQNGILIAGFRGSNAGWQSAYVRPPKTGEELWGHAVALIGFNKNYLIGQNSWGESWGDKGLFYVPKDYSCFEAWACLVDLPNDFIKVEKPIHNFTKDMKLGWKGTEVEWLQKCLKYAGVFPQIIDFTGYYGKITEQAVKTFQATYNLSRTGITDAPTRAKLNTIFS